MPRTPSPRPTAVKPPSGGIVSVRVRTEQDIEKPQYDFLVAEASQRGINLVELLAQITAEGVHRFMAENNRSADLAPVVPSVAVPVQAPRLELVKAAAPQAPGKTAVDSRFVLREGEDTEAMLARVSKETGVPLPIVTMGYTKAMREQVATAPAAAPTRAASKSKPKQQPKAAPRAKAKTKPKKAAAKSPKKKAASSIK